MRKREKSLSINGISTSVIFRQGQKPAIVCIHGNSLSKELFNPLFDDERLQRFSMLSFDLPGHGASSRSPEPECTYNFTGYAGHIELLLGQLGLDEVVLLGFSLGGHLAMEAAGNNISSYVKGLCAIGTPPLHDLNDFSSAFLPLPDGASLFVENIIERHASIIVDQITSDDELKPMLSEAVRLSDPMARKYFMQSLPAGIFHSEHGFLNSTVIPSLMVYGDDDRMINPDYINSKRLSLVFKGRKLIIPNAEHLPSFTGKDGFMNEFYSFLERVIG